MTFRVILAEAWEKSRGQGLLWFLLAAMHLFSLLLGYGLLLVAARMIQQGAASDGTLLQALGSLSLTLFLLVAVMAPAWGSGLMALFRQVQEGERPSFASFARHTGTYYWRFAGGALLFFFFYGVLRSLALGGGSSPWIVKALFFGLFLFFRMITLYWSPAVAMGNRTTLGGVHASTQMALGAWLPTALLVLGDTGVVLAFQRLGGIALIGGGFSLADLASEVEGRLQWYPFWAGVVLSFLMGLWELYFRTTVWTFFRKGYRSEGA
ncbi:MAG: hypothetical protein QJR00_00985 [Bacillota bacterium]|nr:hypothetical protein [Bacillota bacterium]